MRSSPTSPDRVIAMSFPSSGKQSFYRNPIKVSLKQSGYMHMKIQLNMHESNSLDTLHGFNLITHRTHHVFLCRRWRGSWTLNMKATIKFTTCAVSWHLLPSHEPHSCFCAQTVSMSCFQVRKATTRSSSTIELNGCSLTTTTSLLWSEYQFLLHKGYFVIKVMILTQP